MKQLATPIISYASGIGAGDTGCMKGPLFLKDYLHKEKGTYEFDWLTAIAPKDISLHKKDALPEITKMAQALATQTANLVKDNRRFIVLGGDHTSAIGVWSGVANALPTAFSLLWIDAHVDAHTFETSPSNNIHGMPVATLLGYGDKHLTQIGTNKAKLQPESLIIFGARSYEKEEWELLRDLHVKIFTMADIKKIGLEKALSYACGQLLEINETLGITIDLDSFDPLDVPSVGSPEKDGLRVVPFLEAFKNVITPLQDRLIGLEISEYNPNRDANYLGAKTVKQLIEIFQG